MYTNQVLEPSSPKTNRDSISTIPESSKQDNIATTVVTSTAHLSSCPRSAEVRTPQNFLLIWLDANIDKNYKDFQDSFTQLQEIVSTLNTFTNIDTCVEYVKQIKFEKIFLIFSETLNKDIVPLVHDMIQIDTIFLICRNKDQYKSWAKQWPKVQLVSTSIRFTCMQLRKVVRQCDHNAMPMNFVPKRLSIEVTSNKQVLDQLELSFVHSTLFKTILLKNDQDDMKCVKDLVGYCRQQNISESQLKYFQHNYHHKSPIWWYTYDCFLYSMLNKALRSFDIKCIIKFGFFIRQLNRQLEQLYKEQSNMHKKPLTMYRGQIVSKEAFEGLSDLKGGLLAFNNFLSASTKEHLAMKFVRRELHKSQNLVGILFVMNINLNKMSTTDIAFANIDDYSAISQDDEILFTTNTIFRVCRIQQMDKKTRIWKIELKLIDDHDPHLANLINYMNRQLSRSTGWQQLGDWLLNTSQYKKAEELYINLIKDSSDDHNCAYMYSKLGWLKYSQNEYTEAIAYYQKSLIIYHETLNEQDEKLGDIYKNMAMVYEKLNDQSNAIDFYQKSCNIYEKVQSNNHPNLVSSYKNLGQLYNTIGNHSKALEFYEKYLKIMKNTLPSDHADLATYYNIVGTLHNKLTNSSKALENYEQELNLIKQSVSSNNPELANSYNRIAILCEKIGDYSKALDCYESASKIYEVVLSPNHPDLANSYSNMGRMYKNLGNHKKTLEFYEKSLEMMRKNMFKDQDASANTYLNIGSIYHDMGNNAKALELYEMALSIYTKMQSTNNLDLALCYSQLASAHNDNGNSSKALEFYEKAQAIQENVLTADHPNLAMTLEHIASVYNSAGDFAKALEYYEKALNIKEKSSNFNQASLASSYNNVGSMYCYMGDYKKALKFYKKTRKILEKTLSTNDPDLASFYNNIGKLYDHMEKYSKAVKYYEKTLKIDEHLLSSNDPSLATSYNSIGQVYSNKGDYSKALEYYEKALKIREMVLPRNHPDLAFSKHDIGVVHENMGDYSTAQQFYEQTISIAQLSLPSDHPHLQVYALSLHNVKSKM